MTKYSEKNFAVDHFVPWSFVASDELWDLIPMDKSLNSSKSNRLPEWDKYFALFAETQYVMYQNVQRHEKIMDIFQKCKRDNLVMPWSLEELYVPNAGKAEFAGILEKNLKSVYDSAKMQGYEVWVA